MAKTNTAETEEKTETGDAPLIDLNEAQLKKLILRSRLPVHWWLLAWIQRIHSFIIL